MARGSPHTDETKAAVIAALLAGEGVNEISRRLQLPKQTVSRIRTEIVPEKLGQVGTEKANKMDELLVDYLESNLGALKSITKLVQNETWLYSQSASAVAELHDELSTKAIRLFEAQGVDE